MKHKKRLLVYIIFVMAFSIAGCSQIESKKSLTEDIQPIYEETISPNKEYTKKEEDIVYYHIEVYQEDNSIIVNASSNSAFFEGLQYVVEYDKDISESDVNITWTTLMGNTEYTEDDNLAIADISISENGEIFSQRKVNFVNKGIEIVVDTINGNKRK